MNNSEWLDNLKAWSFYKSKEATVSNNEDAVELIAAIRRVMAERDELLYGLLTSVENRERLFQKMRS